MKGLLLLLLAIALGDCPLIERDNGGPTRSEA